ncbi:hypothetical protein RAH32_18695 [Paracoccus sp. WLY502]|uniref:hypothetical protein n=1 Tax=Paracoccus yibinensis TaxID=3068891 RepID=UPI0027968FF3|nr:hypothetical protein [Paracoccus sp. WLY502]MDQ1902453.1 hypothetical protein [Paracoccus sp. WLY502]
MRGSGLSWQGLDDGDGDGPAAPRSSDWLAAQSALAVDLAGAALGAGRLEARLSLMDKEARAGAIRRLALVEIEEMLRAQGTPLSREEIGLDAMAARAGTDLQAMAQARWALRRLEGQSDPASLRDFLALHRNLDREDAPWSERPVGAAFDAAADDFLTAMEGLAGLHPLARAPAARMLWRLADLSPDGAAIEGAVWAARDMARAVPGLSFLPLGSHGRAIWADGGPARQRLSRHLAALARGTEDACRMLDRLADWAQSAREATATIKGRNPARIIAALAAHPILHTAQVEELAGISRDTAERLLSRMRTMKLVREITGARRFRLWAAAM